MGSELGGELDAANAEIAAEAYADLEFTAWQRLLDEEIVIGKFQAAAQA